MEPRSGVDVDTFFGRAALSFGQFHHMQSNVVKRTRYKKCITCITDMYNERSILLCICNSVKIMPRWIQVSNNAAVP